MASVNRSTLGIVLVIACAVASAAAFADCQTFRPATATDVTNGQGAALLEAMVAACKIVDSGKFFDLQTDDARQVIASISPAEKKKLLSQYCAFTAKAVSGLGGDVGAGVHSVGPYKKRTKCGAPQSYWFVHNKAGELVLRLEVAVESGRLMIDTH